MNFCVVFPVFPYIYPLNGNGTLAFKLLDSPKMHWKHLGISKDLWKESNFQVQAFDFYSFINSGTIFWKPFENKYLKIVPNAVEEI